MPFVPPRNMSDSETIAFKYHLENSEFFWGNPKHMHFVNIPSDEAFEENDFIPLEIDQYLLDNLQEILQLPKASKERTKDLARKTNSIHEKYHCIKCGDFNCNLICSKGHFVHDFCAGDFADRGICVLEDCDGTYDI